ncbi:MAG: Rieske (2Fe-2S) protein [Pseudomonadota bacterium]
MDTDSAIFVSDLAELQKSGVIVVRGEQHNIAVFAEEDKVFAVDNRCPHMGFPLDRGSVKDGMLTCHWHQARFDLKSGCTFDLWADDVLQFAVWVEDGKVYVSKQPPSKRTESFYRRRLIQGIEQNVSLVQAKSLLSLLEVSDDLDSLLDDIVSFASINLGRFSEGMTRLACIVNLAEHLDKRTLYQGLLYATRQIANETSSSIPHRIKPPLTGEDYDQTRLKQWLRQWTLTRHRDGAERTMLTGCSLETEQQLVDLLFGAASERLYAGGGHLLEDFNKVFDLNKHLEEGYQKLLPLLVEGLTQSRGEEESTNWHHPIDIISPINALNERLPTLLANNNGRGVLAATLIKTLQGDDPLAILNEMEAALANNVAPLILAREVAYAAALRLARFATSNEVTDWFNPQHTYIYANAAYNAVKRSPTPDVVRAVFQGAMSVYMDRFLNVPPARLPSEKNLRKTLPNQPDLLLEQLLSELDQRSNIDDVANVTARYISLGHDQEQLINTLAMATVREDIDFHSLQVLDAAVNQSKAWEDSTKIENIFVGVVRNLAAHCPTRRAGQQTARIAEKLQRGEPVFEEGAT